MALPGTIERVLAAEYLDGLSSWSNEQVRRARAECEREEAGVSYARRVLQGRIDLLRVELERRHEGGHDLTTLLADLPRILASDQYPSDPLQARAVNVSVPEAAEVLEAEIDEIVDRAGLDDLGGRDADDLAQLIEELATYERYLSGLRRQLFERIDMLRDELVQRYKDGRASVGDLLGGQA